MYKIKLQGKQVTVMRSKITYRKQRNGVDRIIISAIVGFQENGRRCHEICEDMHINLIETKTQKTKNTIVVPNDVCKGEYRGNSPEQLRLRAYQLLGAGETKITYTNIVPGLITKKRTHGTLYHFVKELNYRITQLGRTLMALTKVEPDDWRVMNPEDVPQHCSVTELRDCDDNRYLLVQNLDIENKGARGFRLNLKKKYRIYRVSPHDGRQLLVKETDVYGFLVMPGDADLLRFQDVEEEAYLIEYALKK